MAKNKVPGLYPTRTNFCLLFLTLHDGNQHFSFPISVFRFRLSDFGFLILVFQFRFYDFGFPISVFRFWLSDFGFPILCSSLSDNLISLSYSMPPFSANLFGLFLTRLYVSSSKQLTPLKGRPANNVSLSGLSSHLSVPNVEKQCNYAIRVTSSKLHIFKNFLEYCNFSKMYTTYYPLCYFLHSRTSFANYKICHSTILLRS